MTIIFKILNVFATIFLLMATKFKVRLEWATFRCEIKNIPKLYELYTDFRKSPEAKWTIAENDALFLYTLVLQNKPKNILELGMGIGLSAAIMGLALRENGGGKITSLEQSLKCVEIANRLIPHNIRKHIEIIRSDMAIFKIQKISNWVYFCGYNWLPQAGAQFDFVFIDGPAGWIEDGELVSLDAGDIFRLLPYFAPHAKIYIDGRRSLVKKIERYLMQYLRVVERNNEFVIFERNENPILSFKTMVISDAKLNESKGPNPYEQSQSKKSEEY